MTQARSILPDRLKRARFTTIAKDPSFRRYFAAGDDSASIRTVLTHLYEARGNARRLRDLERQAGGYERARTVGARCEERVEEAARVPYRCCSSYIKLREPSTLASVMGCTLHTSSASTSHLLNVAATSSVLSNAGSPSEATKQSASAAHSMSST